MPWFPPGSCRRSARRAAAARGRRPAPSASPSARCSPCASSPASAPGAVRRGRRAPAVPRSARSRPGSRARRDQKSKARHQRLGGDAHVLLHAQAREHVGDLEGLGDAQAREAVLRQAGDVAALERMRPSAGAKAPESTLKKVLLPAPFGPMIDVSSPARNAAETSVQRARSRRSSCRRPRRRGRLRRRS